ncbi:MAG TPA: hypothetical protein VIS74_00815 [Chthoniobacterales bacterium]
MDPVYQCLRQLRRRLWWQCWARGLAASAVGIGAAEIALGFARIVLGLPPFDAINLAAGLILAPLLAALLTLRRSWNWQAMAAAADELGRSRDRFRSYLEFSAEKSPSVLQNLALRETRAFAAGRQIRPPRGRWGILLGLAPVLAFGLVLQLAYFYSANRLKAAREAAAKLMESAAPEVAALARRWQDPRLEKAAEALREQAAEMSRRLSRDPRRAALDAIARSEEAVRNAAGNLAELAEAAQALAEAAESPELREAIGQRNYAQAAGIARQMPDEQVRRAIAEAAAARNLPALDRLREIPNPGEAAAQMLRQAERSAERNREMEKLLAALRDLKLQPGPGDKSKPDQAAPASAANEAAAAVNPEPSGEGNETTASVESPAGQGEKDGGGEGAALRPADLTPPPETAARKELLASLLGEGGSLQDLVLSGAGDSEAKRRYQAIYQAAQADEAAAVERENIPVRSRSVVKRYLESIRPGN